MIEDALKTTRAIHRLLLTASLATVVFSCSLQTLPNERKWKNAIETLIQTDFLAYEGFIQQKVNIATEQTLQPLTEELEILLKKHLMLSPNPLTETLSEAIHVGKILINDLILANVSVATLAKLNEDLSVLEFDRDVQILVPRVDELVTELKQFLDYHKGLGPTGTVDGDVEIQFNYDDMFVLDSFLPIDTLLVSFSFQLLKPAAISLGKPDGTTETVNFKKDIYADVHTIAGSSFTYWIENEAELGNSVAVRGGKVIFGPALGDMPTSYKQEQLGELLLRLDGEITRAGPASRSISILGTQVPGLVIGFASPLSLFFLAYYFMTHLSNLRRLARRTPELLQHFAWLPLILKLHWTIPFRKANYSISGWMLETTVSVIVLPIFSLAMLHVQLSKFSNVDIWQTSILLSAATGIFGLGIFSLWYIRQIRACMVDQGARGVTREGADTVIERADDGGEAL